MWTRGCAILMAVCAALGRAWAAEPADNNGVPMRPRWCGGAPESMLPWNDTNVELQLLSHQPHLLVRALAA
jgi:hypothetical protein